MLCPSAAVGEARALDGALVFRLLGLPPQALPAIEDRALAALRGDTSVVSALRVLQLYLERLGAGSEVSTVGWLPTGWPGLP